MTSSTQPPSLSHETGPPAHERAQETVGAVDGATDNTRRNPLDNQGDTGGVFASAGQAARQYLPTSVVGTLEGAGVLSGPGTQTANANANANTTSLPSQESSFKPSASGVGSLPGTASEADVAKLPEERALEDKIGGTVGREGVLGTGISDRAGSSTSGAGTGSGVDTGLGAGVGSKEPVTEKKAKGGPSAAGTTTAAQFLDSSLHPVPSSHGTDLQRVKDSTPARDNISPSSIEGRNKPLPPPGGNTNTLPDDTEGDNDTSYARDQGQREPARAAPNHAYTPPGSSADLPVPGETQTQVHGSKGDGDAESTAASIDSGGKPSLKQKIKGEVKVLAGKVSKDSKKVEAGKALKEGHAAAA